MDYEMLSETEAMEQIIGLQNQILARRGGVPTVKRAGVADHQTAQNFYGTGGLFADCTLQRPVVNAVLTPQGGLASRIPVIPTNFKQVTFGFVTQIDDGETTPQDEPCDPSPQVGDVSACKASFSLGRIEYGTKTAELDELIALANSGVHTDLYFVGDVRGKPAIPTSDQLNDPNLVTQSAVRRQLMLWGRRMQKGLHYRFWNGDPTAVSQNGTNGGWKSFWGLNFMIADDYDDDEAKPWVTGTNCGALNSDVKDFSLASGGGVVGTDNLYQYLQELADTLEQRAFYMGLEMTAVIVMHPILWAQVIKALPCDMIADGCSSDAAVINLNDGGRGMFNMDTRKEMARTKTLELNGKLYDVVLDDGAALTAVSSTQYKGSIYFVPLTVGSEEVLYWTHMNYTKIESMLQPIPGSQSDMRGWTDGGRFHFIISRIKRCFNIDGKIEPALIFRAPHLAGRVDNVTVNTIQAKPHPAPSV